MFRKPRDRTGQQITPSVGRPPSPPHFTSSPHSSAFPQTNKPMASAKLGRTKASQKQISSFFNKVTAAEANAQRQGQKQNESILKFFQKVDAPVHFERDLFVGQAIKHEEDVVAQMLEGLGAGELRYNESGASIKKRRTSGRPESPVANDAVPVLEVAETDSLAAVLPNPVSAEQARPQLRNNPFEEDSDEEIEHEAFNEPVQGNIEKRNPSPVPADAESPKIKKEASPQPPPLLHKDTSWVTNDDVDEFDDFVAEEFYENGEEYIERKYMEEQAALERDFEDDNDGTTIQSADAKPAPNMNATCPLCNKDLVGCSEHEISIHVNKCLDGNTEPDNVETTTTPVKIENEEKSILSTAKRFQRSAIPRPGQSNPESLAPSGAGSSAFSKLMSSHAEDEAWALAASNEMAARGKPAFKRTCPFYKIMPGFFTCVDAFRYGAVEGCNAYFLSHFHSDHYIGLTSTWCHGPIYCSKVTGNLVRQQLRVDPRWVVDLEWETKTEVPNTEGLFVTMISANHCPGSSLFLFEKIMTKGSGNSKLQRVLHCGDFRACPAHVQHPLLKPDVIDSVSGHSRQQKLDVCYLDTTYLTPKYAFPSQESVIQACADMCVSLSKDQVDEFDIWEKTKKARAGSGMVKFVQKDADEGNDTNAPAKGRGKLLVVCGTYSIGKERICVGIARALKSKIYAAAGKRRICQALEDPELASLLTDDPYDAQIHMQMLMEIRPETLADYLAEYKPHFSRIVGFRPTGWSYRPPNNRFVESPLVQTVLHSENWKTSFSMAELMPQRGSTKESSCFGVPYSEHSSFRELTMFCCALRIDKIIPTVNIGSAKSREKMKAWIEKWNNDKKKNGLFKVDDAAVAW